MSASLALPKFASGGYPWTIIPLEKRDEYMAALEAVSTKQDIEHFAKFLGMHVQDAIEVTGSD